MQKYFVNTLICFIYTLFFGLAYAELPPGTYDQLKGDATEYLNIKILKVETGESDTDCRLEVTYNAEVLEVFRSSNNLQAGDEILIHSYDREDTPACTDGWAGPQVPDLLAVEWIGNTYLNTSASTDVEFDIAAYGQSFEMEDDQNESDSGDGVQCFIQSMRKL